MGRASPSLAWSVPTRWFALAPFVALTAMTWVARAQGPDAGTGAGSEGSATDEPAPEGPTGTDATPRDAGEGGAALPLLHLSESALAAGSDEDDEDDEDDPILAPTARVPPSEAELDAEEEGERALEEPDGEPTIIDDDMELAPDPPDLPEFRLRAGAGVALPTAGEFGLGVRLTQEFEWQPPPVDPLFFALGGAEVLGAGLIGYAHLRAGLRAWFCDERPIRCQAAIALVGGAAFGQNIVAPNFAGDTDLRLLFWDWLELHLRGGFSFLRDVPFIDITGGLGIAF